MKTLAITAMAAASTLAAIAASPAVAAGDALRGQQLYDTRCVGCHSVDEHRVGPAHRGVFGSRAGSREGFAYSAALQRSAFVWNETTLAAWLADPEKLVPGQAMNVQVGDVQAREDIVAFLRTLTTSAAR